VRVADDFTDDANESTGDDNWIVIYHADDLQQAQLVRSLLEDNDIAAHVLHDRQIDLGPIAANVTDHGHHQHSTARVLVRQCHGEAAYNLIVAADEDHQHGRSSPDLAALEAEADRATDDWPVCPDCRRRRHTSCPVCKTAGTQFPAAFHAEIEDEGKAQLLVLCTTCDEAFAPKFPARCEWCGHHFPDGWELPPIKTTEPIDINGRVVAALVGVVLTVVGLMAFFARIFSE
jgi:hypothetical protein